MFKIPKLTIPAAIAISAFCAFVSYQPPAQAKIWECVQSGSSCSCAPDGWFINYVQCTDGKAIKRPLGAVSQRAIGEVTQNPVGPVPSRVDVQTIKTAPNGVLKHHEDEHGQDCTGPRDKGSPPCTRPGFSRN